tara:strand:+ start:894 stop:1046 length:153 start_codon:yes stop_codon:yes gene_type:complete
MSIKKEHDASRPPGEEQKPRGGEVDVTRWKHRGKKRKHRRKKSLGFNLFT